MYCQDPLKLSPIHYHPTRVEELMPQVADLVNRRSKRERIKRKAACPPLHLQADWPKMQRLHVISLETSRVTEKQAGTFCKAVTNLITY